MHNQPFSMPVVSNQSQACQQLLPQNMQNSISSAGVQNSASFTSIIPAVGNLTQDSKPNNQHCSRCRRKFNGTGVPPNVFANSQRLMAGRQQVRPTTATAAACKFTASLSAAEATTAINEAKVQQRSIQQSLMQSRMQQQQRQNLLQPAHTQTSQQAVMQPSVMQSTSLSNLQQNQQTSVRQGSQAVL
ncbi:hypothetical protein M9H77_25336 [Catharanthus roseus]|uniref:Uncharacterized protein n=1 Tax=Catharanthus roseus TaxID=4058 RepID=A0ACC0AAS3_CATRO|nr:hypothetical protein M9H77_25336 [Catharanthus roseus]